MSREIECTHESHVRIADRQWCSDCGALAYIGAAKKPNEKLDWIIPVNSRQVMKPSIDRNRLKECFYKFMDSENLAFQFTGNGHPHDLLNKLVDEICDTFGVPQQAEGGVVVDKDKLIKKIEENYWAWDSNGDSMAEDIVDFIITTSSPSPLKKQAVGVNWPEKRMHPLNCIGPCNCTDAAYNEAIDACKKSVEGI